MSPENMQQLMRMFYSQYMSQMGPQMQGAQQGLDARLGKQGLTHSGVGEQLRAGIPGQFANSALGQAGAAAQQTAGSRANIIAGQNLVQPFDWGGISNNLASMAGAYGLLKNTKNPQQASQNNNSNWSIQGPGHGTQWT